MSQMRSAAVSVFGRNLTDERTEAFVPIADLFATGSVNRPRSYELEAEFQL